MFFETPRFFRPGLSAAACCIAVLAALVATPSEFPPLAVEISPAHPLLLFQDLAAYRGDPERQKEHLIGAWAQIPNTIRSNSVLKFDVPGKGMEKKENYERVLPVLQEPQIPTAIRIADNPQHERMELALVEALLRAHTMVRGVEIVGLDFRYYDSPRMRDGQTPVVIDWLIEVIDVAARYGRFVYLPLDELQWVRIMSNTACTPLYEKIVACKDYVIPASLMRGDHTIPNQSAVMGLWLEGGVSNWGMAADALWYADNHYVSPGYFGDAGGTSKAPAHLYRAMILNGAMTGATVYSFENGPDLWYGPARFHWDEGIYPVLRNLVPQSLVGRKDLVMRQIPLALQLVKAGDPETFHLNLKDIDGVLDQGNLLRAAYGLERPGQIAELVPNRGDVFWIPFLSPHVGANIKEEFPRVVTAGTIPTAAGWVNVLAPLRKPQAAGDAFVSRVGVNAFVMNTRENVREPQAYTIKEVAAPIRAFTARRENGAVVVSWGFRENDVEYRVYRRVAPETEFTLLSPPLEQENRSYVDTTVLPDQTVAYSVTAVTDEREPLSGVVDFGTYLAFSVVESRIAEEVVLTPVLAQATSSPVAQPTKDTQITPPWWPDYQGVPEAHREAAQAIVEQIELWDEALVARNLNGIMSVYSTEYSDPEGWGFQYAQRAYQWLLERYRSVAMHRQIRQWDFTNAEKSGEINLLLYVRIAAVALTDSSGLRADITIELPQSTAAEVWTTWSNSEGVWRMVQTNPALPNFRELLSYEAGPYDNFPLGPDRY